MSKDFFDLLDQMIEELNPEELRRLAIEAGVPQEELEDTADNLDPQV